MSPIPVLLFWQISQDRREQPLVGKCARLAPGRRLVNPALLKTIWLMVLERCQLASTISRFKTLESELTRSWVCLGFLLCLLGKEALLCLLYFLAVELESTDIPWTESTKDCLQLVKTFTTTSRKTIFRQLISQTSCVRRHRSKAEIPEDSREEKAKRTCIHYTGLATHSPLHFLRMVLAILMWLRLGFPTHRISSSNGLYMNVCFCERHEAFP